MGGLGSGCLASGVARRSVILSAGWGARLPFGLCADGYNRRASARGIQKPSERAQEERQG